MSFVKLPLMTLVAYTLLSMPNDAQSQSKEVAPKEVAAKDNLSQSFFAVVGRSVETEELLGQIFDTDKSLFAKLKGDSPLKISEAYSAKFMELKDRFRLRDQGGAIEFIAIEATDVATLLLLGANAKLPPDHPTHLQVSLELFRSEYAEVLTREPLIAELYNNWAISLQGNIAAWRSLRRASDLKLVGALPAARQYASSKDASAELKAMAITLIGQLGTQKEIPRLIPLLNDTRLPRDQNAGSTDPMQVRDLALVTMVELVGQDPVEFGCIEKPPRQRLYTKFGFASEKIRREAIEAVRAMAKELALEASSPAPRLKE